MEITLEKDLKKKIIVRRVIEVVLLVCFLTMGIVCMNLREQSKVVEIIGEGIFTYESITYTKNYLITPTIIGIFTSFMLIIAIICDFIYCGIKTTKSNNDEIMLYTGFLSRTLYINGKKTDVLYTGRTYLECVLPDGVRMTASYQFFNSFHLTFSDNRQPIDF